MIEKVFGGSFKQRKFVEKQPGRMAITKETNDTKYW